MNLKKHNECIYTYQFHMHDPVEQELTIEHSWEKVKENFADIFRLVEIIQQLHIKDTDCLDCFEGHVEGNCAHASAFPVFVLQDVRPHHHSSHAEHLFQLFPSHFVVKLEMQKK